MQAGIGALVAAAAAAALLPSLALAAARADVVRSFRPARHSLCDQPPRSPLSYGWPVRPFDVQHPVRGNFGDPRTVATESPFGQDTPLSPGSYNFHNGIDVVAATGEAVYAVVGGVATIGSGDLVLVHTRDGRLFQYYHVRPAIRNGQVVVARQTVIGHVLPRWFHVHLTEIDGFRVHNPAAPGHLEPYRDGTTPAVDQLLFTTPEGRRLDPRRLSGVVSIAADAHDTPPLPVPGEWFGFPVTPAFVAWRLETVRGKVVVPQRTVADFRRTEPRPRLFWRVYAAGTFQNFPVFNHHYYFRRAGRYLFDLTPTLLDTRRLANGDYVLVVDVGDVCGNGAALAERVAVRN